MKFCVIGLGHFGKNLALNLARMGAEVLALDTSEEHINLVKDEVSHAVILDATDAAGLRQLPLRDMDAVIVAIGDHFEDSLLATAHLQEIGVKKIIARVVSPVHEKLLKLMKVDNVIVPEAIAASRMAKSLMLEGVLNSYELAEGYDIVEILAPASLVGKTIVEANLRATHQLNLITIKRPEAKAGLVQTLRGGPSPVLGVLKPDYVFQEGDVLVLFGQDKSIRAFIGN